MDFNGPEISCVEHNCVHFGVSFSPVERFIFTIGFKMYFLRHPV